MKIVSSELGRVSRYFVSEEIRPVGGLDLAAIIKLAMERYGFAVPPNPEEISQKGAIFQRGRRIIDNKTIIVPTLIVYNDGMSISAFDTDTAELLLDDAFRWAVENLGMRNPITPAVTTYESHIVVEFESQIDHILLIFDDLSSAFRDALRSTYSRDVTVGLSRIALSGDPPSLPPQLLMPPYKADFGIERRLGRPFAENRYYSIAPLRSSDHQELLMTFESLALRARANSDQDTRRRSLGHPAPN